MIYGITGNTQKEKLWQPVTNLVRWLSEAGLPFCMKHDVAEGLLARGLIDRQLCDASRVDDLARSSDVVLSFGGDGTLLQSAQEVGRLETPILGVNIGRLGFLAEVEVGGLRDAIQLLEEGRYRIESRMLLKAEFEDGTPLVQSWALNEFVIESSTTGMITVEVSVDGTLLNHYWADGLIVSTPTGSTAYNLSLGGPIIMPGANVVVLTPIAPHSLTVRPFVLSERSLIEARIRSGGDPYIVAADGTATTVERDGAPLLLSRADHTVRLVKLPDQHYFRTIRSKLMWGARKGN